MVSVQRHIKTFHKHVSVNRDLHKWDCNNIEIVNKFQNGTIKLWKKGQQKDSQNRQVCNQTYKMRRLEGRGSTNFREDWPGWPNFSVLHGPLYEMQFHGGEGLRGTGLLTGCALKIEYDTMFIPVQDLLTVNII